MTSLRVLSFKDGHTREIFTLDNIAQMPAIKIRLENAKFDLDPANYAQVRALLETREALQVRFCDLSTAAQELAFWRTVPNFQGVLTHAKRSSSLSGRL